MPQKGNFCTGKLISWTFLVLFIQFGNTEQARDKQLKAIGSKNASAEKMTPQVTQHGSADSQHHKELVERYPVVSLQWHHVATPFTIVLWLFLAGVAKIAFHHMKRVSSIFPDSSLLIMVGLLVGIILFFAAVNVEEAKYHLSSSAFFMYLLPPIVFDAGYFMPNRAFFDNLGSILCYAVIGTIWNMVTIGGSLYLVGIYTGGFADSPETQFLPVMVFAALISAVDPVAVLVVFEEINVHETLYITVFGESLLNDAVTVVLYRIFLAYVMITSQEGHTIAPVDYAAGFASFFVVGLGGVVLGVFYAYLGSFTTKFMKGVRVLEPLFVFLTAYGAYLTAEIFSLSGILAIVFCGIIMKQYLKGNISQKSQTTVKYALKMLSSSAETVIFMFLGLSTVSSSHLWDAKFIVLTLVFCLVYRALGVIWQTFILNKIRLHKFNKVEKFIMAYGGLRGAVAYGMAVALNPEYIGANTRLMFISTTIVVIFFTVFLQGMTIKPLVNLLKVKTDEKRMKTLNEQTAERLIDHTLAGLEDILGYHGHNWLRDKFEYYNSTVLQPIFMREPPNNRDAKIIRVFTELSIRDAQEELQRTPSFIVNAASQDGIAALIRSHSYGSFKNLADSHDNNNLSVVEDEKCYSNPCLDVNSLDPPHPGRKLIVDSKLRHLMDEHMYKPKIKVKRYSRQEIDEEPGMPLDSEVRHRERYRLRHLLSQKRGTEQLRMEKEKEKQKQNMLHPDWSHIRPPKKTVSFIVTEPLDFHDEDQSHRGKLENQPNNFSEIKGNFFIGSEAPQRSLTSTDNHRRNSLKSSHSDEMIIFEVKNRPDDTDSEEKGVSFELGPVGDSLTAAEAHFPWKSDNKTPNFKYEGSEEFLENEASFLSEDKSFQNRERAMLKTSDLSRDKTDQERAISKTSDVSCDKNDQEQAMSKTSDVSRDKTDQERAMSRTSDVSRDKTDQERAMSRTSDVSCDDETDQSGQSDKHATNQRKKEGSRENLFDKSHPKDQNHVSITMEGPETEETYTESEQE